MDLNRPDVAAILARKKILADIKNTGRSVLTAQQMSLAFLYWPLEHVDYFANAHGLVIVTTPKGTIEVRPVSRGLDIFSLLYKSDP